MHEIIFETYYGKSSPNKQNFLKVFFDTNLATKKNIFICFFLYLNFNLLEF